MDKDFDELKFHYLTYDKEKHLENLLKKILKILGRSYFFYDILFLTKELIDNACKANYKRIFFQNNNLDINDVSVYKKNIDKYKEAIENDKNYYFDESNRHDLYVKLNFKVENNHFVIIIENNSPLLAIEKQRIREKFDLAKQHEIVNEHLLDLVDPSEGGGLGIILTILMLHKIGLDESYFRVIDFESHTRTILMIPLTVLKVKEEFIISNIAKKEIEDIPQFPDNITALRSILNDPNSSFYDLAGIVKKDTPLIVDLMKLANSGLYIIANKVKTIEDAIRLIGFNGIKNIVYSYNAKLIMEEKYTLDVVRSVIDHSNEVALYSIILAKLYNLKEYVDEIFTAAILHDFGKIIINSLQPNIVDRIAKICRDKGMDVNIVENFTAGFNHSLIGAELAEKWNFSESLIETIKYHHSPDNINIVNKTIVNIVYLSNTLYYYKRGEVIYVNINRKILSDFNLIGESVFNEFADKVFKEVSILEKENK